MNRIEREVRARLNQLRNSDEPPSQVQRQGVLLVEREIEALIYAVRQPYCQGRNDAVRAGFVAVAARAMKAAEDMEAAEGGG